ncbi:type I-G CRISPR-associated RAMP protein Csb1/Cas7g [Zobellella sp. An-6]|uniref:type I-G CRISPR-associated RAMP protein Csb1/Cas7g n=1 Tax=Zobellella sp. An-6 TaxID=3400218 RepID=UPI004041A4B6
MSTNDITITNELLDQWATNPNGPVALHLKQKLLPVEGEGGVIFPPTYADIGYNIDTLSDGTKVATIDSVGSQANRMEPMFKSTGKDDKGKELNPLAALVPQIEIILSVKEKDGEKYERRQSLLDLAHRSADAVVKATPELRKFIDPAFVALNRHGNAEPLCAVAPTSLLFGVWDSRDGTGEKRPRLVRSVIRAWDVDVLHSAAQFNSVWKVLGDEDQEALKEEEKKKGKTKLSVAGLADAPSTFRTDKVAQFVNGAPNPEARVLGGVLTKGAIERNVTINLVALRTLHGANDKETKQIRKYLLSLALLAATAELDLFLREGCLLRYANDADVWMQVPRRGEPIQVTVPARDVLMGLAIEAVKPFAAKWPKDEKGQPALEHKFDIKKARELLSKKAEEEAAAS